jgi:cephalosporin hydroxylase
LNKKEKRIAKLGQDQAFQEQSGNGWSKVCAASMSTTFSWLGRPIIQNPIDMVATQEIIWSVQPDLIIETGIAHGGSLIFRRQCWN